MSRRLGVMTARAFAGAALLFVLALLLGARTPLWAQEPSEAPAGHAAGAAADGAAEPGEGHGEAKDESPLAEEHGSLFYGIARAINHVFDASGETKVISGYNFVTWTAMALLLWLALAGTAKIRSGDPEALNAPSGAQNFLEALVDGLFGFFGGIIGPHGRKYCPLVVTFFLFILMNNWIHLIPGFVAPTASLNLTVALGLSAFVAVQYYAVQANGLKNYLLHFAGQPKDTMGWCMAVLMFPLEIIGELVKPLSLSMRLFGNIFGEDTVVLQILLLWLSVGGWKLMHGHVLQPGAWWVVAFPMHLPMQLFSIFGGLIQALVFSMLVSVYISLLTSHDEDHHHEDEHTAPHH